MGGWWRRLRAACTDLRWLLAGVALGLAAAFILYGLEGAAEIEGTPLPRLYVTLRALGLAPDDNLPGRVGPYVWVGRWLLVLITIFVVWNAWAAIFHDQWDRLRLAFFDGHAVICGGGDAGRYLARAFRERDVRVVMLDGQGTSPVPGHPWARGTIALAGDPTDPALLRTARVRRARYLVAVSSDDGANVATGMRARDLAERRTRGRLTAFVHVADLDLYRHVKEREFGPVSGQGFRLQLFNLYERGARELLETHPIPVPAVGPARVVFIGLGRFGRSAVVQAARTWWADHGTDPRLHITVVDRDASAQLDRLMRRHPGLQTTCALTACDLDTRTPEFEQGGFLEEATQPGRLVRVYVCLGDEEAGLAAALVLRPRLRQLGVCPVVRVAQAEGLAALMQPAADAVPEVAVFGLLPSASRLDHFLRGTNEVIARALHDEYLHGLPPGAQAPTAVPWDELDEETRESNRTQADGIGATLAAIGLRIAPLDDWTAPAGAIDAVGSLARAEHERWRRERLGLGWRHALERDDRRRMHPDLVPWEQLPEESREKNRRAVRAMPGGLARAGLRAVPDRVP